MDMLNENSLVLQLYNDGIAEAIDMAYRLDRITAVAESADEAILNVAVDDIIHEAGLDVDVDLPAMEKASLTLESIVTMAQNIMENIIDQIISMWSSLTLKFSSSAARLDNVNTQLRSIPPSAKPKLGTITLGSSLTRLFYGDEINPTEYINNHIALISGIPKMTVYITAQPIGITIDSAHIGEVVRMLGLTKVTDKLYTSNPLYNHKELKVSLGEVPGYKNNYIFKMKDTSKKTIKDNKAPTLTVDEMFSLMSKTSLLLDEMRTVVGSRKKLTKIKREIKKGLRGLRGTKSESAVEVLKANMRTYNSVLVTLFGVVLRTSTRLNEDALTYLELSLEQYRQQELDND